MPYSQSPNPLVDAPAIDFIGLLGRCLGNLKIVERVLATFLETGSSDLHQLQGAADKADYAAIVEIAHRFKGSASNVSAKGLTELLIDAERFGHDQDDIELSRTLQSLWSEWEAVRRFAQAFVPAANESLKHTHGTLETRHACAGR
ncbi:Hpt domain-containing protein [Schlesneria paludicola]|uniref:Hpt domain-containing protein n=1 Tax=Schlesneria paludicola TaxID=360056 RepID=UPI00029A160E|nr:Hpt domain-containing protein [Schlesneria paludicola]